MKELSAVLLGAEGVRGLCWRRGWACPALHLGGPAARLEAHRKQAEGGGGLLDQVTEDAGGSRVHMSSTLNPRKQLLRLPREDEDENGTKSQRET